MTINFKTVQVLVHRQDQATEVANYLSKMTGKRASNDLNGDYVRCSRLNNDIDRYSRDINYIEYDYAEFKEKYMDDKTITVSPKFGERGWAWDRSKNNAKEAIFLEHKNTYLCAYSEDDGIKVATFQHFAYFHPVTGE